METIRSKPRPQTNSARIYRLHIIFCVFLGLCLGCFIAYAQQREWLPCRSLDLVYAKRMDESILGACLTQASPLALLFFLGLHHPSYYYTSRLVCLCFGFWHGGELFRIGKAVSVPWGLLPFCALLGIMIHILLHAVLLTAKGITVRHHEQGIPLPTYCYHVLRLFGALLIVQLVFNTLLLRIV